MRTLIGIILTSFLINYGNTIRTYNMENYCGDTINMILSGFEQGKIILNTNSYSHDWDITGQSNSCELVLESWYSREKLGFYFEFLNLPCDEGYLSFYDGDGSIPGLSYVCGSTYNGQYVASSRKLKIEYTPLKAVHHYNVMTLIATAFHEGHCASYEYSCDNGRCIADEASCTGYKSCGDGNECHLSAGAVAGIVIGSLAGATGIVIVIVVICCCMRKQRLPTTTTVNTGGQVVYMAQAVPAVSINNSQQPPPYSLPVNQQLYPAGYTNVNPGFQTNVNPGFQTNVNPGFQTNVNPGLQQQEQQEFKNTNLSNPTI